MGWSPMRGCFSSDSYPVCRAPHDSGPEEIGSLIRHPPTIKTLAARIPSLNFLSEMGTETELASAATSVLELAAPAFIRTG